MLASRAHAALAESALATRVDPRIVERAVGAALVALRSLEGACGALQEPICALDSKASANRSYALRKWWLSTVSLGPRARGGLQPVSTPASRSSSVARS